MIQKNPPARAVGKRGPPPKKKKKGKKNFLWRAKERCFVARNAYDRGREDLSWPQKTSYNNNDHDKALQYTMQ